MMTNPTIDLLASHASVRSFRDEPVSDQMLTSVLEAARRAPTSSNWQTYSVVVVRDPDTKQRLSDLAGGQRHIVTCDVFVAFCADLHRLRLAGMLHDKEPAHGLEHTITSVVDASIVGEAAQVAAESFGLGAVMVGSMRARPSEVAELLGLPGGVFVVFGMSIGWPAIDPRQHGLKPRLPADLVIHQERYSDEGAQDLIASHDNDLRTFYEAQGRNMHDAAWSGPVAERSQRLRYDGLRSELETMGFSLD